jgi:hypothetical protein
VPISGKYTNPDIGVAETIINIFRNAFIEAYEPKVDNTISLKDVAKEQDQSSFWEKFKGIFNNDHEEKTNKKD